MVVFSFVKRSAEWSLQDVGLMNTGEGGVEESRGAVFCQVGRHPCAGLWKVSRHCVGNQLS